jgi:hypothetical protein
MGREDLPGRREPSSNRLGRPGALRHLAAQLTQEDGTPISPPDPCDIEVPQRLPASTSSASWRACWRGTTTRDWPWRARLMGWSGPTCRPILRRTRR